MKYLFAFLCIMNIVLSVAFYLFDDFSRALFHIGFTILLMILFRDNI